MIRRQFSFVSVSDLGLAPCERIGDLLSHSDRLFYRPAEFVKSLNNHVIHRVDDSKHLNSFLAHPDYAADGHFAARISNIFWTMAVQIPLTSNGQFIKETFPGNSQRFTEWPFTYLPCAVQEGDVHLVEIDEDSVPYVDCDVVLGMHGATRVFGHFVLDGLSTAFLFRDAIRDGAFSLALYFPTPWMLGLLAAIGIEREHIVTVKEPVVRFRSAVLTSALGARTTYRPHSDVRRMFEFLKRETEMRTRSLSQPLRLFLLRGEAERRIENEAEIAAMFADLGFVCLMPHRLPVDLQLFFMTNADIVAGTFGSSFALAPTMRSNGSVIEILPNGIEDPWLFRLLSLTGLRQSILIAEGDKGRRIKLDVEPVREAVRETVGSNA